MVQAGVKTSESLKPQVGGSSPPGRALFVSVAWAHPIAMSMLPGYNMTAARWEAVRLSQRYTGDLGQKLAIWHGCCTFGYRDAGS